MKNSQETILNKNNGTEIEKTLPNFFNSIDEDMPLGKSILTSIILHPTILIVAWVMFAGLTLLGIVPKEFNKPQMHQQDIEFVLVNKEAEPINKNTKYRSDRNSRAGGIHDPKRKVSEPSPAGPKSRKSKKASGGSAGAKKVAKAGGGQNIQKTVTKTAQAPSTNPVAKPKPAYAPKPTANPKINSLHNPSTNLQSLSPVKSSKAFISIG